jgi:tRNA (Thr-GGU) A37 N-methylase
MGGGVLQLRPIGLHVVEIPAIEGEGIRVRSLEALDGTPILDVKPRLGDRSHDVYFP